MRGSEEPKAPVNTTDGADVETAISWTGVEVILVDEFSLNEAESYVDGCERCTINAAVRFEYVLDALTDCDPTRSEYLMWRLANCPRCGGDLSEKTFVLASGQSELTWR